MNKKILLYFFPAFILLLFSIPAFQNQPPFNFVESNQGLELRENGKPVLFYQCAPKSLDGKFARNNYIHPLYGLNGDTLTEDFPPDHRHQRGVFWAWHQLLVNGQNIGDGWLLQNFNTDVVHLDTLVTSEIAGITVKVFWSSPAFKNGQPFLEENSSIRVYVRQEQMRIIDFKIGLIPLVDHFELGGSDDEKGYGGFSVRMKLVPGMKFISDSGEVKPQLLQINAGPWMDISGPLGRDRSYAGITILSHPTVPNFPPTWILRREKSMQNVVYPGKDPVSLTAHKVLRLRYRLIVHSGKVSENVLSGWFRDYSNTSVN